MRIGLQSRNSKCSGMDSKVRVRPIPSRKFLAVDKNYGGQSELARCRAAFVELL
jgi:hypothetical protein